MATEEPVYVQLGPQRWQFGGEYLKELESCNPCLNADDIGEALRQQLDKKGYIYLKQVLPEDEVLKARATVLEYLQQLHDTGHVSQPVFSSAYIDGILANGCDVGCIPCLEGKNSITNHPAVFHVIEHPFLHDLFTKIFHNTPPITFDYKWLRGMHQGGNTGCHMDRVYMGRGSADLLTCWIPFDHLTLDMSVLAILEGSHRLDQSEYDAYKKLQLTYANLDVDRDRLQGTGWFTEDPMEFYQLNDKTRRVDEPIWKTNAFAAGDILIFTMRTIHMSSVNLTRKLRLSCDTRWQPSDQLADPRFVCLEQNELKGHAEMKFGLHAKEVKENDETRTTMRQWREIWGFS